MKHTKKLICLMLALLMIVTLAACGEEDSGDTTSNTTASAQSPAASDSPNGDADEKDEAVDDGSVSVLLPTICYFSEANDPKNANHLEYDSFGNMNMFRIVDESMNLNKAESSTIETDEAGKVTYVKNFHRDAYNFVYGEDGAMTQIYGMMNYGENSYTFQRSDKEGCAYQLTVRYEKNYVVEQYTEDYRLIEQLYYTYDNETEPFHRRYYTYDANGVLTKWEKAYDGRYDFTDEYTSEDFCEMGHCMVQNLINGRNFEYTEYAYNWTSQVEKDGEGRVIKDAHTCPDVQFEVTYDYSYGADGEMNEFGYTIVDTEVDSYARIVYSPVKLQCDPLQMALIMIYSRDVYPNNFGSFRSITVKCER